MASSSYDLIDNIDGSIVSRGVTAAEAAVALGLTAQEVTDGVTAASYVDGNDLRCTGYWNIYGDDYWTTWKGDPQ